MKPTAILINCARGGILDEQALATALLEGQIAGAAVDVWQQEPPPVDHPLFALENVIVSPHMAAHTEEAMIRMATDSRPGHHPRLAGRTSPLLRQPRSAIKMMGHNRKGADDSGSI